MAEESKVDYVDMGSTPNPGSRMNDTPSLPHIDSDLSQEEKDLRLAMALQQEENANAYESSKKRHEQKAASRSHRTIRSNAGTSLSSIRATQKASAERVHTSSSSSAANYYAPSTGGDAQELADARLAGDMQRVEQATAGTARMMAKIQKEEESSKASAELRNARSGIGAFKLKK